jgi:hypothetical protein
MREIETHKVNGCNEALTVAAVDEPGSGGANHRYAVIHDGTKAIAGGPPGAPFYCGLDFQNGPIAEVGTNGITHEALLAVVIDRLQGFQAGPFACRENALALTKLEEAMHWLNHRTRARVVRGVEGTHKK